jgi:hypothetical protein
VIPSVVFLNAVLDVGCYAIILLLWRMTTVSDRTVSGLTRLTGVRNVNPTLFHSPKVARSGNGPRAPKSPFSGPQTSANGRFSPTRLLEDKQSAPDSPSYQALLARYTATGPDSPASLTSPVRPFRSPEKVYPL